VLRQAANLDRITVTATTRNPRQSISSVRRERDDSNIYVTVVVRDRSKPLKLVGSDSSRRPIRFCTSRRRERPVVRVGRGQTKTTLVCGPVVYFVRRSSKTDVSCRAARVVQCSDLNRDFKGRGVTVRSLDQCRRTTDD